MPIDSDSIVNHVESSGYRPLKLRGLARSLSVATEEYPGFRALVKQLVAQGRLQLGRGSTIRAIPRSDLLRGIYHRQRGGYAFVRLTRPWKGSESIFIRRNAGASALDGDEVLVRLHGGSRRKGESPSGRVVEVVSRRSSRFVGTFFKQSGQPLVQTDGGKVPDPFKVIGRVPPDCRTGDKVIIEIDTFAEHGRLGEATITERLGDIRDPGVDTVVIMREFGLSESFSDGVRSEAARVAEAFDPSNRTGRTDLTMLQMVAIDPPDARDHDDAVHVEALEHGQWRLGVHIADVASFVQEDGPMDREARRRGSSVYLPGRVVPMLPEEISGGIASLHDNEIRYCKSVLIHFNESGTPLDVEVAPSVIKVTQQLDYPTVMGFFKNPETGAGFRPGINLLLENMRKLAAILRGRRSEKGYLELALPEVELSLDDQDRFERASLAEQDESHKIIEEFMLSANEAVARYLADRDITFIRRIHESPDPLKLDEFAQFARSLGYKIRKPQSREEVQALLAKTAGRSDQLAIHYALLRSLKRAIYSPDEVGHFAIGSSCYCHFTSPIRRYPDLWIHRRLDSLWNNGRAEPNKDQLASLAEQCTRNERVAAEAEYELIKLKTLIHLEPKVGMRTEGTVSGVEKYGVFIKLDEYLVDGFIHRSSLPGYGYQYDPVSRTLYALGGKEFRVGNPLSVRIESVDLEQRFLDLTLSSRD